MRNDCSHLHLVVDRILTAVSRGPLSLLLMQRLLTLLQVVRLLLEAVDCFVKSLLPLEVLGVKALDFLLSRGHTSDSLIDVPLHRFKMS